MIKFFFNRFSKMVSLMEVLGIIFMGAAFMRTANHASPLTITLFAAVSVEYAFIRYCAIRRWHKDAPRYSGIELQFKKALVPTSYILAITGACLMLFSGLFLLIIAAFLLAVIVHVNVILIYFHRRDKDKLPPNFFSSGTFLNNDAH